MTVWKFFIIGLYTVTKFPFNLCDLGYTYLASLLLIFLTEQNCFLTRVELQSLTIRQFSYSEL